MQQPYSISLYPGTGCADGKSGDHVILAPAYNITSEEVRQIVDITAQVIVRFFSQKQNDRSANGTNGHGHRR
jgi:hypothetical protein